MTPASPQPAGGGALRRHADELSATSEQLAAQGWEADRDAGRTAAQAQGVSDAAEQTAGNVGSVAVAAGSPCGPPCLPASTHGSADITHAATGFALV